jgi:hypothetical protein
MRSALIAALALLLVACGPPSPRLSSAQPGPMPEGGAITGTYFIDRHNYLMVVEERGDVRGEMWLMEGAWAVSGVLSIKGRAVGDLVRFTWYKLRPGGERLEGRGYFRFIEGSPGFYIAGEYGMGEDEVGTPFQMEQRSSSPPDFRWEIDCQTAPLDCPSNVE